VRCVIPGLKEIPVRPQRMPPGRYQYRRRTQPGSVFESMIAEAIKSELAY